LKPEYVPLFSHCSINQSRFDLTPYFMRIERRGGAGEHTVTASQGDNGVRQVLYLPARPTRDGRTVLALSPLEFLAALSRLIPPPRVHRHRYHGVLAPNARLRERVIHLHRETVVPPGDTDGSPVLTPEAGTARVSSADLPDSPQRAAARSRWARLLARIYEVFPLTCPDCGADMRILAFITATEPTDAILTHLGLPTTPPPFAPARGPPQPGLAVDAEPDLDLDQTPAYDLTEPEPIPNFDFDQSAPVTLNQSLTPPASGRSSRFVISSTSPFTPGALMKKTREEIELKQVMERNISSASDRST
jgi:hypothetical protein